MTWSFLITCSASASRTTGSERYNVFIVFILLAVTFQISLLHSVFTGRIRVSFEEKEIKDTGRLANLTKEFKFKFKIGEFLIVIRESCEEFYLTVNGLSLHPHQTKLLNKQVKEDMKKPDTSDVIIQIGLDGKISKSMVNSKKNDQKKETQKKEIKEKLENLKIC